MDLHRWLVVGRRMRWWRRARGVHIVVIASVLIERKRHFKIQVVDLVVENPLKVLVQHGILSGEVLKL